MRIGTAEARRGGVAKGYVDLVSFPTGGTEKAPVMVARGDEEGPTLWLTANVHGNEVAGIPVVHRTVTEELAERIRGTVVGVVTLNPSGLRSAERTSHYDARDPNRLFPDFRGERATGSTQELINRRIFGHIERTADALIDLHCSNVGSVPFSILDRLLIGEGERADDLRSLVKTRDAIADAFGFTPIHGSSVERTVEEELHRSLSGACMNAARVPAFTAELGSDYIVERDVVEGAVVGVRNVMRELGMLDSEHEEVPHVTEVPDEFPVRRTSLSSPVSGLLRKRIEPGYIVREGEAVAEITDSFGETKHVVEAPRDGWVTSFQLGMGVEEGSLVCYYAERAEDDDLVETYG
ncbi:MAG: succinylglutamate desuccinylase/aspartoacylase family protein [Halobacteriales archaeon]